MISFFSCSSFASSSVSSRATADKMGCDDRRYIDRSRYRFSIHATRRQHTRVLPLLVIASWLGCFLDTGSGLSSETDVAVVFVDVYQGSSERTCGSEANPCDLVSRALDHVNLVNHSTILINLSATRRGSENFVQPDRVDSRSNIIVNGMAAGIISVEYNKSPADPNAIWLDFVNCSYVTIQHLQLNLENFTGDSAVAFRSSMSCSVENSMFMYAPLNCSTIKVMNTWPFQVSSVIIPRTSNLCLPVVRLCYCHGTVYYMWTSRWISCTTSFS